MDTSQTYNMQTTERESPVKLAWLLVRVPEILSAATLAALMIFLVLSVFSRYAMNLGLPWSDELARLLFAWIVLIGFAMAVQRRANVGVDWLVSKTSLKVRKWVYLAQDLAVLGFSIFFTWASYVTVGFSMMQRMPALGITIAWMYGSCLAAGVLMIIYATFNLISTASGNIPVPLEEALQDIKAHS